MILGMFFACQWAIAQKFSVSNAEGVKIEYEVLSAEDRTVEVVGGKRVDNLIIPATVEFNGIAYNIISIKKRAFSPPHKFVHHIRNLVLPEGLIFIGEEAFWCAFKESGECSLYIPNSVKFIGSDAFAEGGWAVFTRFKIENIPSIVTPYSCEGMGIGKESVKRFYAFHPNRQFDSYMDEGVVNNLYQHERKQAKSQMLATSIMTSATNVSQNIANSLTHGTKTPINPTMNPQTIYSGSSEYYTSPAYLAQVQARANQSMANYQAQMQRIGQQAIANAQQGVKRINQMFKDMADWSYRFNTQNGRFPTDYEKTQWVSQNYPDMLSNYVLSQGGGKSDSNCPSESSSPNLSSSVDYRLWYQKTEENIANLHRSFSTSSSVTTTTDGKIKDTSSTSGGTYLQMQQTYKDLQKELKNIREEAAQNGITITPSQWETSILKY